MLLKMHCSLHARKLALLLSSDSRDDDTPILEAAACDVLLDTCGQGLPQGLAQGPEEPQGQLQQLAGEAQGLLALSDWGSVLQITNLRWPLGINAPGVYVLLLIL